jgi:hypothetical protein
MKLTIGKVFQLQNKWIKTMLMVSIVIVIGLSVIPDIKQHDLQPIEMPMQEIQRMEIYDSTAIDLQIPKSTPIQIEIIEKEKPFDWKEMISWVIGAINGVVLLVMNIRNIRKK